MGSIEAFRHPKHDCLEERSSSTGGVERLMGLVVAESLKEESEFEIARAKRIGRRYKEAASIAGPARNILEALLVDEIWPVGEKGHIAIKHALERLSYFFNTGTKARRIKKI